MECIIPANLNAKATPPKRGSKDATLTHKQFQNWINTVTSTINDDADKLFNGERVSSIIKNGNLLMYDNSGNATAIDFKIYQRAITGKSSEDQQKGMISLCCTCSHTKTGRLGGSLSCIDATNSKGLFKMLAMPYHAEPVRIQA